MSFKELRSFTEIMRSIGFPKLISMEGFRTPNFGQIATILTWLLERYDHTAEIPTGISSEEERVQFLKTAAQIMLAKARIKLNTRRLYSADVHAVKELLKLAQVLYDATNAQDSSKSSSASSNSAIPSSWNPAQDVRAVRQIASEMTTSGASIHGLIDSEVAMQDHRMRAMRELDNEQLEKAVHGKTRAVTEDSQALSEQLESLGQDEASLRGKIEKKKQELERVLTRLRGLRGLRPAFMDELEKLESELQQLYSVYLEKFRNLDYLESELDAVGKRDDTKDQRRKRVLSVYTVAAKGAEAREMKEAAGNIDGDIDEMETIGGNNVDDDAEDEDEEETGGTVEPRRKGRSTPGPAGRRSKTVRMNEKTEEVGNGDGDEDEDNNQQVHPERKVRNSDGARVKQKGPKNDEAGNSIGGAAIKGALRVQGSIDGPASDDSISPVVSEDEESPHRKIGAVGGGGRRRSNNVDNEPELQREDGKGDGRW